jgi:hypothetical protein
VADVSEDVREERSGEDGGGILAAAAMEKGQACLLRSRARKMPPRRGMAGVEWPQRSCVGEMEDGPGPGGHHRENPPRENAGKGCNAKRRNEKRGTRMPERAKREQEARREGAEPAGLMLARRCCQRCRRVGGYSSTSPDEEQGARAAQGGQMQLGTAA